MRSQLDPRSMRRRWRARPSWLALAAALAASGCGGVFDDEADAAAANACLQATAEGVLYDPGRPGEAGAPEIPTGFAAKKAVQAQRYMVAAAHPVAAKAGCEVLKAGGTAVDAAIATQMVLNLVEPQSSGIGGGAFMLRYDAASGEVTAYDGRETAPAAASEDDLRFISAVQRTPPLPNARASGRSIGTPGVLRMLELAHADAGRLPWARLFEPAIQVADEGFRISPRMAASVAASAASLKVDPDAAAYFLNADGSAKAAGTLLKSPALGATFRRIAEGGAEVFYRSGIAADIVGQITAPGGNITPGRTTLADLESYQAKKRTAVCTAYRQWQVCGMPPPSSGGLAVAQALGILAQFDLAAHKPTGVDINGGRPSVAGVHLVAEAQRLAYADRNQYVADTDFVPLPGGSPAAMLDAGYLAQRAALIRMDASLGTAPAGVFGAQPAGAHLGSQENGTTQITVIDKHGNAVSMTSSIEAAFGSFQMTAGGFLLNNQLTDFSPAPTDANGLPIANRLQAGKRPRSSMAPTLVFDLKPDGSRGPLRLATGSPGGATIIQYVTKTLVGVLDWGLDAQQATSMVNFGSANGPTTNVGGEHPNIVLSNNGNDDPLIAGLRALGHTVNTAAQTSGIATLLRKPRPYAADGVEGGADPRREGVALGDAVMP